MDRALRKADRDFSDTLGAASAIGFRLVRVATPELGRRFAERY